MSSSGTQKEGAMFPFLVPNEKSRLGYRLPCQTGFCPIAAVGCLKPNFVGNAWEILPWSGKKPPIGGFLASEDSEGQL